MSDNRVATSDSSRPALALRRGRSYPLVMLRSALLASTLTACLVASSGCSSNHYVQRGADLYDQGRYVEADEVFERSEPRVATASLDQRATYAVYRGATFVALGDLQHAQRWLNVASEIEHTRPGTLPADQRAFLDGAWQALAKRMPSAPVPVSTAVASAGQEPSPSLGATPPSAPLEQRALVPQ